MVEFLRMKTGLRRLAWMLASMLIVMLICGLSGCAKAPLDNGVGGAMPEGKADDLNADVAGTADSGEGTGGSGADSSGAADSAEGAKDSVGEGDAARADPAASWDATPDAAASDDAQADMEDTAATLATASRRALLGAQIDAFEAATAAMALKYEYVEDPSDEAAMLRAQLEAAVNDADLDEVGAQLSRAVGYVRGALYVVYDTIYKPADGGDTSQIEADMAAYEEAMAQVIP